MQTIQTMGVIALNLALIGAIAQALVAPAQAGDLPPDNGDSEITLVAPAQADYNPPDNGGPVRTGGTGTR